jgi:enoyl-CoA hydratase/carnithine racemase
MNLVATEYEVRHGAAWITLNRPENRNALSAELVNELYQHLEQAAADDAVRTIVITGNGSAFCAGADLKSPPGSSISGGGKAVPFADVLECMLNADKPLIAAVNGAAFGGGIGLLAACDIIIADEAAQFSFSEVRLGVIPAVISVLVIPKLGVHQTKRLFLTGQRFTGQEAVAFGLVHEAVPASGLIAVVEKELEAIIQGGPNALKECKQLIREIPKLGISEGLERASEWSVQMFESSEAEEGMAAFREKRSPDWLKSE